MAEESSFQNRQTGFRAPARLQTLILAALTVAVIAIGIPLYGIQQTNEARVSCQTNERRIGTALMLYAQDHNGCLPPPDTLTPRGWKSWVNLTDAYLRGQQDILSCPSNPALGAKQARLGYAYPYSYALNERFFGVFSTGPFPLENVEIPEQTVLLAESGWRRKSSPYGPPGQPVAMSAYTDTGIDPLAFPSPHDGRMTLTAADGHASTLRVAHYSVSGHDPKFGRIGGALYNWNGGHPNGETAAPPHE